MPITSIEHAEQPKCFHMRIVNGGTPERIPTTDALREIANARVQPVRRAVRTMSTGHSQARIVYKDDRGEVLLRPATSAEAAMDIKPESERYAPGDPVIVRPVSYDPEKGTHRCFPEYEGTVVSWDSPYKVRALTDEHGHGVRPCHVHELRPAVDIITGALPDLAGHRGVGPVLSVFRAAGTLVGSLNINPGGSPTDGVFVTLEPGDGNVGLLRVLHLIDGRAEESLKARENAEHRAQERAVRNKALDAYAGILRAAGWKVEPAQESGTGTRCVRHLVVCPQTPTQI